MVFGLVVFQSAALDLSKAVIFFPSNLSATERKAVTMLVEEVEKRTQIRMESSSSWPSSATTVIAVGPAAALDFFGEKYAKELSRDHRVKGAEGYRIRIKKSKGAPVVFIIGNDARGVMFGVGHLLRTLRMSPGRISLPDDFNVATAPKQRLRGHQLGYRPKTNSYDGWDVPTWEQYIRDLIIFGCNAIELIPPRSDDASTSPHFPLPPMEMMVQMSRLADEYGMDVWIWYPAMDRDYSNPKTVEFALNEWGEVFKKLPRIDAIFVPGGDPGHTQPKYLMALLEKQTASLHHTHPKAQMWVSPQSFNQVWLDEFLDILKTQKPAWLSGVVYGPQVRVGLPKFRAMIPKQYPIRNYPDITHSWRCEYPVPDWDSAFPATEGREPINPRPLGEAAIFRYAQPYTIGFLTYSEGCNDDVNKAIWSALGWNPSANVTNVLREFSLYFIGERYEADFAQGLLALERNWRGALLTNENVYATLQHFQAMEKSAPPQLQQNWRFQQALYRAYYDAYTRSRLIYETDLEEKAMSRICDGKKSGLAATMSEAEAMLDRAETNRVSVEWHARVFELAEALFKSIKMQLSVPLYKAIAVERGANLDNIDVPLNSRVWLKQQFAEIRELPDEAARLKRIDEILTWTDPGPGGFYDDLGDVRRQPHLVRGPGFEKDPRSMESSMIDFGYKNGRLSWWNNAGTLFETPLKLRYTGLDRNAQYQVRVNYASDSASKKIRLLANDKFEIHPFMEKRFQGRPLEFDVSREATKRGELTLNWNREPGLGDNGRGCQVAEVWLMKK
ncbi:MAG: hypothetical protein HY298_21850 [Verrucomicrobia bacterium]|nr:hypothetical protein [Verrucomicrobiota bacterium]